MYFSSADKKILIDLFKEQCNRQIYYFYQQYNFSPAQLSRFVRTYQNIDVISVHDDTIELTEFGKKWVLKNRRDIFLKPKEQLWRTIPSEWIEKQK